MKFTVLQENILPLIQDALRFISSKPQLPILSGIYLEASDNTLIIRSTDLRVGFHSRVRGKIDEDGKSVIPAKTLSDFLSCLTVGPVLFEIDQGSCKISQGKTKATIQTFPSDDFPPFPVLTQNPVEMPFPLLFELINKVSYAASLDETRPILASILLKMGEDSFTCVGTDGYRLAVATTNDITSDVEKKILLNAKAFAEVMRTLWKYKSEKILFTVSQELQQVSFSVGDTSILLRLTEGEFPPYQTIIPSSFLLKTFLDREALLHALKTSLVFAKENSSIVSLTMSNKNCAVTSTTTSTGGNETVIESSYEGEEEKHISFNAKFLMDTLSHIETDRVEFCMNDELKSVLILPEGDTEQKNIIMPFKR